MHILFVSMQGLSADLAWQMSREGHKVRYSISETANGDIGDGLVHKVKDWRRETDWADLIIFDDVCGQGRIAQQLRLEGHAVIGGTPYTDRLEDDRQFGQDELQKAGVPTLEHHNFGSFKEAIAFVEKNPALYVFKPCSDSNLPRRLVYIGEAPDGSDLIDMLRSYEKKFASKIRRLHLQKKVLGVEVGLGGFFNGEEFIEPIAIIFEHKRYFTGNLGPLTGEMGSSMFWSTSNKLFRETLGKMVPRLKEENFRGYFDINCIVNKDGIFPLEFTTRFGYPTICIQLEGITSPLGEFFLKLGQGKRPELKTKEGFQIGVRLCMPPFPFNDEETFDSLSRDVKIRIKDPSDLNGFHIEDAKYIDNSWYTAGTDGCPLVITGSGATMEEAQRVTYKRISRIHIPNMYFRTDIGAGWSVEGEQLGRWGYLEAK